jgi:hypothetical protein
MMKKLAAAIAVSMAAGVTSVYAAPQTVIDDSKNPQYLVTMAAATGTFAGDTLTLAGVPLVVYFSDRPKRVAGHMDLQSFLQLWDEGGDDFKHDPPNAELAIYEESGVAHAVLIISKPAVDADSISFQVDVIDEKVPATFGHATLFIDGLGILFPSNQN